MLNLNSAVERDETPHATNSTQDDTPKANRYISVAYRQRAESVISDRSIDAHTRVVIRYALETNDPWLVEMLSRAEAGKSLFDGSDLPQARPTLINEDLPIDTDLPTEADLPTEDKIETLTDIICSSGDAPTRSAALLVLIAAIESSPHPKALANIAKWLAFTRCGELNVCGMVESQIAVFEAKLLAGHSLPAYPCR